MSKLALAVRRALIALLIFLLVFYLGDFGWFELRNLAPRLGPAYGSVHRIRLLAIPGKANKVEYQIDPVRPEEDLACSHSLFPHGGTGPCWYVLRHANDPITM